MPQGQEDPMLRLRYYRETGQDAEAQRYERYLRETGQYKETVQPAHDFHAEYESGNLAKRMAGANARDAANVADEEAAQPGYPERLATHVLNAGQGIPGMEAVEAAIGAKVRGVPYAESLKGLKEATGQIGGKTRIAEKMMGGLATLPFLPASPVAGGALLGGADQLLGAEGADKALHGDLGELGKRAVMTGVGAAGGALVGKTMDLGMNAVMAALAKNPESNILARQAARSQVAKRLYDAARSEGNTNPATQQVKDFLAEPEIARRIQALQQLDQFKGSEPDSPEMIDALAKSLSDEAKQIKKGLNVQDPSKPNTGRFAGQNVSALKDRLMHALSTRGEKPPIYADIPAEVHTTAPQRIEGRPNFVGLPTHMDVPGSQITTPGFRVQTAPAEPLPAYMPSYQQASQDFARQSGDIDAVGKGMTALQKATSPSRITAKQISGAEPKTPQRFAEWAQDAPASQQGAAREGVLGDLSNAWQQPQGWTKPEFRTAAKKAGPLLRSIPGKANDMTTLMQQLGLTSLNPFASP